jgi:hypothetical protein
VPDGNEIAIRICRWRLGSYCWRRVTEHRLDAARNAIVPGGGEQCHIRVAIQEIVVRMSPTIADLEESACLALAGLPCRYAPLAPHYDAMLRKLSVDGTCLHRFGERADNEVAILERFEVEGWPEAITDPLGIPSDRARSRYGSALKTAVYCLNRCQKPWLIRFHSQPRKGVVSWEWNTP